MRLDRGRARSQRFRRVLPMRVLIPNAVTMLALCAGLTGVRFAISGEWEKAVAAVIVAGVLDGIDGRIARLLNGGSKFGAELDSLSDVIAFGVAPALIVYLWSLQYLPGIGWIFALAHAVACALRLARFNSRLDVDDQPHQRTGFLTGIPAPVGAGLALSPLFLSFWIGPEWLDDQRLRFVVCAVVIASTAALMASSIPTYAWGAVRLRPSWRLIALLGVGLFAGALFAEPWMTLSLLSLGYAVSIPLAIRSYLRFKPRSANMLPEARLPEH